VIAGRRILRRSALLVLQVLVIVLFALVTIMATYGLAHAAPGVQVRPVIAWDQPGLNPFRGSRWHAVMRYEHMPWATRARLAWRVMHAAPDALAEIDRTGSLRSATIDFTDAGLNDMNFGQRQVASRVTMDGWKPDHTELAAAWCHEQWCIVEPFVCGNISWTTRAWGPAQLQADAHHGHVPEPAGGALAVLALLAAAAFRRK